MAKHSKALGPQIGKRLSQVMDEQGLTVRELGAKARLSHNTIHLLRTGEGGQAGVGTVYNVAKALGIRFCWLALGEGPKVEADNPRDAIKQTIASLPIAERKKLLMELCDVDEDEGGR